MERMEPCLGTQNNMQYKTKFSGKKEVHKTGATRDSREGKGRFDLIPAQSLRRLAAVYERGAKNHGPNNWQKGIPFSRCIDSALRHTNQYKEGMRDEDHLAQAVWNLFAIIFFEEIGKAKLNDLPYYKSNKKQ